MASNRSVVGASGARSFATQTAGSSTEQTSQVLVARPTAPTGVLRLRAEPSERRHIQWSEDVVDNEGMNKKSSKVCCIYHKSSKADESSDEPSSESSSSEDSESEPDNSTARPTAGGSLRGRGHRATDHHHNSNMGPSIATQSRPGRRPSPNAYEKLPKQRK